MQCLQTQMAGQREKRVRRNKVYLPGLLEAAEARTEGLEEEEMINMTRGECKYCGQFIELELEHNPDTTADSKAIMLCDCQDARRIQQNYKDEIAQIKRREDTLKSSKDAINSMFGDSTSEEHAAMPEVTVDFLIKASAMIYDGLIGGLNVNLPHGAKAKITKKKGGLKIERQNTDGEAIEI